MNNHYVCGKETSCENFRTAKCNVRKGMSEASFKLLQNYVEHHNLDEETAQEFYGDIQEGLENCKYFKDKQSKSKHKLPELPYYDD